MGLRLLCFLTWLTASSLALSSEYHGQVTLNSLPIPGAIVTASQGDKKLMAITDEQGTYSFPDLTDGSWAIEVGMTGFSSVTQDVTIAPDTPGGKWELKLLPSDQIKIESKLPPAPVPQTPQADKPAETALPAPDPNQDASDGLLINGSVNNGAASPFRQGGAFGNNRRGPKGLYTGGIGGIFGNSVLDAQPFSLTGQNTPKLAYNNLTGVFVFGGPLRIPHVLTNGPNFFVGYQWTRNRSAATLPALLPDSAARNGVVSNSVLDPLTGAPFSGGLIPQSRISPQARALLNLYPLPNFTGSSRYNYQIPAVTPTHQDALQSRFDKTLGRKDELFGSFAFQSTRADTPNLLGFSDAADMLGINTRVNWTHRISHELFLTLGYQFSRFSSRVTPYYANRENISGNAGIQGNNQAPVNWGPPSLNFTSGIATLTDGLPSFNRNQTSAESVSVLWNHGRHSVTVGGDFRRQQFNYLSQQDPRGTFTFTGAATGADFADFLLGIPDTSSIAFGNADKYFRQSVYDAYIADDWRVRPELTVNAGVRWEYGAPITELYNRLVNLDIAPGFLAAAPVLASNPAPYPNSLIRPDKKGFEPRVGIAWRPLSGSSLVIRAGYGVYYNTSVYPSIVSQLAQQAPLSKTLNAQNSSTNPFTLANGFNVSPSNIPNTFAIDPNFRVGYAQNWQVSVQRDLPASLQMVATYLGIKGTRGLQEFLPNTFPIGAVNTCMVCPAGYVYLASNGNSTREAGTFQLRRRLHNGFTAVAQYTYSKSIDNMAAGLGGQGTATPTASTQNPTATNPPGTSQAAMAAPTASMSENPVIAQNWLNLTAERGLSIFDQRHRLTVQIQYTTGMGLGGGTLLSGWRGTLLKEWTFASQITVGSGLPLTPTYLAAVPGTAVTGTIRPEYTGAPLYAAPSGLSLNPAAYTAPVPGQWGNAGRNSITGPAQFTLDTSMGRTFRLKDRFSLDLRVDSVNALNHVTFTGWNTTINNAQFGLPVAPNAMRTLETSLRLRF
jgi:trimeric autotransporter adhesin